MSVIYSSTSRRIKSGKRKTMFPYLYHTCDLKLFKNKFANIYNEKGVAIDVL